MSAFLTLLFVLAMCLPFAIGATWLMEKAVLSGNGWLGLAAVLVLVCAYAPILGAILTWLAA